MRRCVMRVFMLGLGRKMLGLWRLKMRSPRRKMCFSAAMYGFGGVLTQNYFLAVAYEDAAFGLSLNGAAQQVVKLCVAAISLYVFDG